MDRPSMGYTSARAVDQLALAAHERVDELRRVGRVDAHVRVEDQEDLSPRLAEAQPHGVSLAVPVCLRNRRGRPGFSSMTVRMTASVSSFELPSTNRNSLPGPRDGRRLDQRPDVAGLVAARDHDAHAGRGRPRAAAVGRRPPDDAEHQRELLQDGKVAHEAVRAARRRPAPGRERRRGRRCAPPRNRRARACDGSLPEAARPPAAAGTSGPGPRPPAAPAARAGCSCRSARACGRDRAGAGARACAARRSGG